MKLSFLVSGIASWAAFTVQSHPEFRGGDDVVAIDNDALVKYVGFERDGVEVFLNVKYGEDTGGENRFKPPRPFKPVPGTTYDATVPGPACPQQLGQFLAPLTLNNITTISEDCLNLNIVRPKNKTTSALWPVMLWIHGGSFWVGSNTEPTHTPDINVLESVKNGSPVLHVAINYRLGVFGFAKSKSLRDEKSENAALRDQRLAIEWVRDNIAAFGGDPETITIFGQSSGGLAIGMQVLAFGGTKPLPFTRAIAESQVLEPGINGNFTLDAMRKVAQETGCGAKDPSQPEPDWIPCLRKLDTQTLFNASFNTYTGDIAHNIGDIWLPSIDGDFLPAAPSQLLKEGRFGSLPQMVIGWTDGDVNFFTDVGIKTNDDTFQFIQSYLPAMPKAAVSELLDLYPVEEFKPPPATNLTAEFYRSARIFRDIIMVCEPFYFADKMRAKGNDTVVNKVYLYDFNQTILEPIIQQVYNFSKIGVVHTSEFAYTFGAIAQYNVSGYPFNPTEADYALLQRASRSWSNFASAGSPSAAGRGTLQNWMPQSFWTGNTAIYVIGGPHEGLTAIDGPQSIEEMRSQRLRERCAKLNSDEFIKFLQY